MVNHGKRDISGVDRLVGREINAFKSMVGQRREPGNLEGQKKKKKKNPGSVGDPIRRAVYRPIERCRWCP